MRTKIGNYSDIRKSSGKYFALHVIKHPEKRSKMALPTTRVRPREDKALTSGGQTLDVGRA